MVKKKKEEPTLWVDEEEKKDIIIQDKPKKKRSTSYSKQKGSDYERQIVKELKTLTNTENISTSRASSKKLDDQKIDINDEDDILPCYFQLKKTKVTPSVKKINQEVGKIDKPLCILWNIQETKEGNVNITSGGEYAIIPKKFFYELIECYIENNK